LEKVKCFFNFRSPYAYLGVKKAIEENIDMDFFPLCYMPKEIVEFFVKASGNEYKRSYLYLDCDRLFKEIGIENVSDILSKEANWPKVHAAWLSASDNGLGNEFMMEAFNQRWHQKNDLGNTEIISNICEKISFDKDTAISAMDDKDFDDRLKSYTKIMREYKVFGVPTFVYKGEIFWGQDRIYALKNKINE
jgi:2-hydroxychromene-2-carboxylate isomerase